MNFKVVLGVMGGFVAGAYITYNSIYRYLCKAVLNAELKTTEDKGHTAE